MTPWRERRRVSRQAPAILAGLALAACTPGPDYHPPEASLPDRFAVVAPVRLSDGTEAWWQDFGDPVFARLQQTAMAQNLSLAQARARIAEAEALARQAGAGGLSGNLEADVTDGRAFDPAFGAGLTLGLDPAQPRRRSAAEARLGAARAGAERARLAVMSELATAYVELRFQQDSLARQERDLRSRRRTLNDVRTLADAGGSTRLDVVRAEALVAETEARIPATQARAARQAAAIALLLGTTPGRLGVDLSFTGAQPRPRGGAQPGVPADLLRRRPDIAEAERLYAAAVADIGVAAAARWPSLSLSGQIRVPVGGGAVTDTATAGLTLPVFGRGRIEAGVDAAEARAEQAYQTWRLTVLSAVADVETALAALAGSQASARAAARAAALNEEALALTRRLLDARGDATVLDLLERERAVSDARALEAQSLRDAAADFIALQTALGAGAWVRPEPEPGR